MNFDLNKLQEKLCSLMCAEVKIRIKNEELWAVDTPFYFADGDPYQIYIKEMPGSIIRLTDMGHTMMHLSYDNDIDKFREDTRGIIFNHFYLYCYFILRQEHAYRCIRIKNGIGSISKV